MKHGCVVGYDDNNNAFVFLLLNEINNNKLRSNNIGGIVNNKAATFQ